MAPPDLFATKGIEYLIVIAYLVSLVLVWRFLCRLKCPGAAEDLGQRVGGWFMLPEKYCFHQGHSWAIPEGDNVFKVGMDDFAQRLLGRPEAVELPRLGTRLLQGEPAWGIRVGSNSMAMLSPVEGEVVGVNYKVVDSPEILCSDPYVRGWLLRVKVPRRNCSHTNLMCGKLAQAWLEEQIRAMRIDLGLVLPEPDGPAGCDGFAQAVAPDDWREVAMDLLLSGTSAHTATRPVRRVVGRFSLPDPYCFHQGHAWAVAENGDIMRVGVDEFVGWLLGQPSGVDLPNLRHYLSQGAKGWSMRIGSKSVDILSPVEGEVVAVNNAVLESPEILCSDPYGEGWLLKVRVPDRKRNQNNLLCGGLARTWMEQKVRDLRAYAVPRFDPGMAAGRGGGVSARCEGFAQAAKPDRWEQMVGQLLMNEGCAEEEPIMTVAGSTPSAPPR